MATVAVSAIRSVDSSTKIYLIIGVGVLAVGGWYLLSQNPLGKMISRWGNLLMNPMGFAGGLFKQGLNTTLAVNKACKGSGISKRAGCTLGGIFKTGGGFFRN